MWDKMDWGIFFICTILFMPIGIIFCIMARHEKSKTNKVDEWEDRTFINSYNSKGKYEQRYY